MNVVNRKLQNLDAEWLQTFFCCRSSFRIHTGTGRAPDKAGPQHQSTGIFLQELPMHLHFTIARILLGFFFLSAVNAADPVADIAAWLKENPLSDAALQEFTKQPVAAQQLTAAQADEAARQLWSARAEFLRSDRRQELDSRRLTLGDLEMPFWYKRFGEPAETGARLFISMHGGGGAPPAVNDQQFENQKRLYQPTEGIYLVPRAPTNTWNLWHQGHIDRFFERLITDLTVLEGVDPDQVYIMGYSAGGDGVYQLAPRMADRLAAASMMAGHPNEARPEGLRNIGFTIHMGGEDNAYSRNQRAADWKQRLAGLQESDPEGYRHSVTIHPGMGHWMQLKDRVAVPWMSEFRRNVWPDKVVWVQDDVVHQRFYWLQRNPADSRAGDRVDASVEQGRIRITASRDMALTLLLHDHLANLDAPLTVQFADGSEQTFQAGRTAATMAECLLQRDDPSAMARAKIKIEVAAATGK